MNLHSNETIKEQKMTREKSPINLGKKCQNLNMSISKVQDDICKRKKDLENRLNQNEQIKINIVELETANQRDTKQIEKLKSEIEGIKKDIKKSEEIKEFIEKNFENSR